MAVCAQEGKSKTVENNNRFGTWGAVLHKVCSGSCRPRGGREPTNPRSRTDGRDVESITKSRSQTLREAQCANSWSLLNILEVNPTYHHYCDYGQSSPFQITNRKSYSKGRSRIPEAWLVLTSRFCGIGSLPVPITLRFCAIALSLFVLPMDVNGRPMDALPEFEAPGCGEHLRTQIVET